MTNQRILSHFHESAEIKIQSATVLAQPIAQAVDLMFSALSNGNKILACGNGGSAADAQHFAAELVGRFERERFPLPAISLATDTSILTSVGNDYGFNFIFSRQVEALCNANDIVVGLSTSGNSANVVAGIEKAREIGAYTIGMTGAKGGKLAELCSLNLAMPSTDTPRIQEAHITVGHILCDLIEAD